MQNLSWRVRLSDDPPQVRELQREASRLYRLVLGVVVITALVGYAEAIAKGRGSWPSAVGWTVFAVTVGTGFALVAAPARRVDRLAGEIARERRRQAGTIR